VPQQYPTRASIHRGDPRNPGAAFTTSMAGPPRTNPTRASIHRTDPSQGAFDDHPQGASDGFEIGVSEVEDEPWCAADRADLQVSGVLPRHSRAPRPGERAGATGSLSRGARATIVAALAIGIAAVNVPYGGAGTVGEIVWAVDPLGAGDLSLLADRGDRAASRSLAREAAGEGVDDEASLAGDLPGAAAMLSEGPPQGPVQGVLASERREALDVVKQASALLATESRTSPERRAQIAETVEVVLALLARADAPEDAAPPEGGVALALETAVGALDDAATSDAHQVLAQDVMAASAHLQDLLDTAQPVLVEVTPRPPTAADILAAQAAEGRADADRLDGYRNATAGLPNGRIPASVMTDLSWAPGHRLRPDAAAQLERLNTAFRAEFGTNIHVTDSYRSFEAQVALRARVGRLAATPGTSNHGWAVAVDLGTRINSFGTPQHRWMRENAPAFGWVLPSWARETGSLPEPWHWEFTGVPRD